MDPRNIHVSFKKFCYELKRKMGGNSRGVLEVWMKANNK